jgi:hypothetical protein
MILKVDFSDHDLLIRDMEVEKVFWSWDIIEIDCVWLISHLP